jgi:lipoprotein-anchoring transpeptidase ErfK/SrfK
MRQNWTDGCIALSNTDMDEIFSVVSLGTPVTIIP